MKMVKGVPIGRGWRLPVRKEVVQCEGHFTYFGGPTPLLADCFLVASVGGRQEESRLFHVSIFLLTGSPLHLATSRSLSVLSLTVRMRN